MKVLYIHGFASAGSSGTAIQMRNHLYSKGVSVISPDVPVSPLLAQLYLSDLAVTERPDLIVATSMGAMYAEQLYGIPRILVNPSFHMAKLLTFRGMGKRTFRNKRLNGEKDFKVDNKMIQEFRQVEMSSFTNITNEEKAIVWGAFGIQDNLVNCQVDFKMHYGTSQFLLFEGEHYLNDKVLSHVVMPLIEKILQL